MMSARCSTVRMTPQLSTTSVRSIGALDLIIISIIIIIIIIISSLTNAWRRVRVGAAFLTERSVWPA
jgi:hypothetical protein